MSGIYQDVTNGGRTAKGLLPFNHETAVRYEVNLDVKSHVNISEKMETYSKGFYKVTDINKYIAQTFGNTIHQLKIFSIIATVVAIFVSILITTLFLKMLVAKDADQIAIMKSIGFSLRDLKNQYITKGLLILGTGILIGTIVANTIGQRLVSVLLSFMGASKIKFVIDPVQAYILVPFLLIIVVVITTFISTKSIRESTIARLNS